MTAPRERTIVPWARPMRALRDHPALVAVCCGLVLGETLVISALGPDSAIGLAPQITAPEPFAIMHDLRWLAVYHDSWAAFVIETLLFIGFRTLVVVTLLRL